jgi:5-methylcytosine-specific restriction enzyme B
MSINFWHIQLHPDEPLEVETIKSILTEKKVVGMGDSWDDKNGNPVIDPQMFKNDMKIGDVVMVRDGSDPVAIVKVVGDPYLESKVNYDYDWFSLRRQIEILGFFEKEEKKLLEDTLNMYGNKHIQAPGTLTQCRGSNATNDFIRVWYKLANYKKLMENIKFSSERQEQIKSHWERYKEEKKNDILNFANEIQKLIEEWKIYKQKILDDSFTLDDYTNTLVNAQNRMPGGYLCNFLERTTKSVLGSSRPSTANLFGVKLNSDGTYYIKDNKANASKPEAEEYFRNHIKDLIKNIVKENDPLEKILLVEKANYSAKQILMKLAVLDNLSDYIYIYSAPVLDDLYNEFIEGEEDMDFAKNHQLCIVLKKLLGVNDNDYGELVLLSGFLWKYSTSKIIADKDNPNVIFYGPPGTGKTYSVKSSLDFLCQGDSSLYEILQFHPSFTYEDFIEGIKPKGVSTNGNIRFELVNGIFKNFCIRANGNRDKNYYFVVDEINRANISSVFGETLSLLEKDYRDDGKGRNLIKTQYSALIEQLIRENPGNEDYKALAYSYNASNGEVKFGIPDNVFFIGMMNDVDKNIDAFDLALRRRFKWERKDCDYSVIKTKVHKEGGEAFDNIDKYILCCKAFNGYISGINEKNEPLRDSLALGKSYEFGHFFFMKMNKIAKRKKISEDNIKELFENFLKPTLKEYLRAVFAESELDGKLDEALNRFIDPINK